MTCETARDLLLEASPRELRGLGDTELARHLRGCPRCREPARKLLEAGEGLARELEGLLESGSEEEILRAVRRELAGGGAGEDDRTGALRGRGLWRIAAPLAAAAALVGVLLVPEGPEPALETGRMPVPPEMARREAVEVEADRRFAVMKTGDPKIRVVWFY